MKDNKKKYLKLILICLIIITIFTSFFLYSRYISTSGLIIKEYKIQNDNITENFHGLKIVHISDIHYKTTVNKKELCNLIDKINLTKPDLVLLTGDLIDKNENINKEDINNIKECFSNLNASLGKYAVMGENDYSYKNFNTLLDEIDFINLNDNYDLVYNGDSNYIFLSGLSSINNTEKTLEEKISNINAFLNSEENKSIYNILLVHEPDIIDNIDIQKYQLILAGHSHNGQIIIPFIGGILHKENAIKYEKKYQRINNTDLFISGGIGTSNIKYRLFNKPSFNLYRITK